MDYKNEILKSIQTMVDRTVSNRKVDIPTGLSLKRL